MLVRLTRLVDECDVVLSIMDPGAAVGFARVAADALRATGRHTLIVDCNAIAPDTVHEIAQLDRRSRRAFSRRRHHRATAAWQSENHICSRRALAPPISNNSPDRSSSCM